MNFTEAQRAAVDSDGQSVMVSAAAGSGKTAVLAARCVKLVAEEGGGDSCGVENLLVVTFTNRRRQGRCATASRSGCASARRRRRTLATPRRRRGCNREIQLLPRASISTLSSFCSNVLRQHFHAAGVDPSFAILDGDQASLLKRTTAKDLFDDKYDPGSDDAATEDFHRLIDLYADGDDRSLIRRVIACHDLLTSVTDPAAWRADALRRVEEAAEKPLAETDFGNADRRPRRRRRGGAGGAGQARQGRRRREVRGESEAGEAGGLYGGLARRGAGAVQGGQGQ